MASQIVYKKKLLILMKTLHCIEEVQSICKIVNIEAASRTNPAMQSILTSKKTRYLNTANQPLISFHLSFNHLRNFCQKYLNFINVFLNTP